MTEGDDPTLKAVEDLAAAALVDFGLHVVPMGDDMAWWEGGGGMMYTAAELLVLARQFGLPKEESRPK